VAGFRPAPRLVAVVVVGITAAVGCAVFAVSSSEATPPAVVRLTDRQTSETSFGNSVGGGEIVRVRLFGSKSTSKTIGHGVVSCMDVGLGERSCQGTYVLPKGSILTGGILKTRLLYTQAIVGGTGLYDNARGTLTVTASSVSPRREILLFRLTG
jgi:hypothetical protein